MKMSLFIITVVSLCMIVICSAESSLHQENDRTRRNKVGECTGWYLFRVCLDEPTLAVWSMRHQNNGYITCTEKLDWKQWQKGAQNSERLTQLGTYMNTLTHSGIKCCYTKRSVNGARYHRGHKSSRNYCEYDENCKRRCYIEGEASLKHGPPNCKANECEGTGQYALGSLIQHGGDRWRFGCDYKWDVTNFGWIKGKMRWDQEVESYARSIPYQSVKCCYPKNFDVHWKGGYWVKYDENCKLHHEWHESPRK